MGHWILQALMKLKQNPKWKKKKREREREKKRKREREKEKEKWRNQWQKLRVVLSGGKMAKSIFSGWEEAERREWRQKTRIINGGYTNKRMTMTLHPIIISGMWDCLPFLFHSIFFFFMHSITCSYHFQISISYSYIYIYIYIHFLILHSVDLLINIPIKIIPFSIHKHTRLTSMSIEWKDSLFT